MNPIVQMLTKGSPVTNRLSQIRQMAQTFKMSNNPQALVNQMMTNNPQVKQIINQYGGDPQTAFYKYAEANGIDPNEILNMLK